MAESKEGTKEPLDKGGRGERKSRLKTQHSKKLTSWHLGPSLHGKQENKGNRDRFFFSWAPESLQMVTAAMKL